MFSETSKQRLRQCDERLIRVFTEVDRHWSCTIITGHRNKADQNEMYRTGKSQLQWPDSNHNETPSKAIDAMGDPVDWGDVKKATLFAGVVLGVARNMGIKLRWGGDWDMDWQVKDNNFDDLAHFELVD